MKLKDEFARLRHVEAQLSHIKTNLGSSADKATAPLSKLAAKGGAPASKLAVTAQDVEVTKSAVLKILMELLKEPDFRDHLLDLGLKAAHARQEADKAKVTNLEIKEVDLGEQEDKAEHQAAVSNMERNKAAGDKVAKEEGFVSEHKDYLSQAGSNEKGAFIIRTIIDKINEYCDKQAAGTQGGGSDAGSEASPAQQQAAIQPLLAAAQAAAEAAWRSGGDR